MLNLRLKSVIALGLAGVLLCGCKRGTTPLPKTQEKVPAQSIPQSYSQDFLKAQRDALDQAKAQNVQVQKQVDDLKKQLNR